MTRIAFFAHDAGDAAVRRRVAGFKAVEADVTGFMMRRAENEQREWRNIDLGQTFDAAYWQRLQAIRQGVSVAMQHEELLRQADLIFARNLDMLICAMAVRRRLKLQTPVVYECLDVHHLLTREDVVGMAMRKLERSLLKGTNGLVYSSPAFEREFFRKNHENLYTPYLLENRLMPSADLPQRGQVKKVSGTVLRIGWFGILRCSRSLDLLQGLARAFPTQVEIITRGIPAETQVPDFTARIAQTPNMFYGGKYQAPQDLAEIYQQVDVVWAGDFYQAGFNSKWLLPNRLYEGGYFSVPAIAPKDSETGHWVERHGAGFTVAEPLDASLSALTVTLLEKPDLVTARSAQLKALADDIFVQPPDEMQKLIDLALQGANRVAA
ncbi:hypothetical protein [Parvularcula sp. IMCC14364]|uniref:hypothetical protein n=1 Tax=Parvularcula sp. IMCC14364 TaxID=3067902 RepID=UPI002741249C|nr:hypothetical protein [Parvularcula sp. IMCC14364]